MTKNHPRPSKSWLAALKSPVFIVGLLAGAFLAVSVRFMIHRWEWYDNPFKTEIAKINGNKAVEQLKQQKDTRSRQTAQDKTLYGNDYDLDLVPGAWPYKTVKTGGLFTDSGGKVTVYEQADIFKIWKQYGLDKAIPDAEPAVNENGAAYGGLRKTFVFHNNLFALVSLKKAGAFLKTDCFFSSIINLTQKREVFRAPCLPDISNIDYNGSGGGHAELDGNLLFELGAPGAYGTAIPALAQDPHSPYGKILLFTPDGLINRQSRTTGFSVYSMGHRNIQGLINVQGDIYAVENGPKGGDEINLIRRGKNYGWPLYTLGSHYQGNTYPAKGDPAKFEAPIYGWIPSISPSDVVKCPVVLAQRYAPYRCLLISSLQGQSLFVVLIDPASQRVMSAERLEAGMRLREFSRGPGGRLFVTTDGFGVFEIKISNMASN